MAGSIEKRGENSYRLIVSNGYSPDGKKKRHTKTIKVEGKTETARKQAAEIELAKFVAEIEGGNFIEPSKVTFKSFSEKWLENYAKPNLAPKTIYEYERLLELRILPTLGHMKLNKIKPVHIMDFYKELLSEDRKDGKKGKISNSTIMHYHRLLRKMFNDAVKWQLINDNPVNRVDPPKVSKPKAEYYDEKEIDQLIKALEGEPTKYVAAILVTMASGLRLGELMGLEWRCVNFEKNTIEIEQANQYLPGEGTFTKDPKNESSIRIISMPEPTMRILEIHRTEEKEKRLKCGEKWKGGDFENGFVFTQWNGKAMYPSTPSKWFNELIERKGLKKITFHQLRHTSATMLINAGLNIRALSARLGHSNTTTTLNIYSHALKSADESAAEKMEKIMFGEDKKEEKKKM